MNSIRPPAAINGNVSGRLMSWPERYEALQQDYDRRGEVIADLAERGVDLEEENALLRELVGPPWLVRVRMILRRICG